MAAPRRLVTGTDPRGRSYFARVETVDEAGCQAPSLAPDGRHRLWRYWQIDRLPDLLPHDGRTVPLEPRPSARYTPQALRRAPVLPRPLGTTVALAEIAPTRQAGQLEWHDSMDVFFVISGQVTHLLASGEEIDLQPGDCLVQNGTNHAWHNRGKQSAKLFLASFGGARFGRTPEASRS